jgi:uncharacterized Rmd1/YagE family protein
MEERYYRMHEKFAAEFELEDRREDLEERLQFASAILRFCMEQKEKKAMLRLDWLIVVMLTVEVAISALLLAEHLHEKEEEAKRGVEAEQQLQRAM